MSKSAQQFVDGYFKQVENYEALIKGVSPQHHVYIKYKLKTNVLNDILGDTILWIAKLFTMINFWELDENVIKIVPLLLVHLGREDIGLKTLGLYLDIMPYVFDGSTDSFIMSDNTYSHALFNRDYYNPELRNKYFEIIPVVNFYMNMDMENVFEDFGEYEIETKAIQDANMMTVSKCLITMRIFNDVLYIIMPSITDDNKHILKVAKDYLVLDDKK